MAVDTKFLGPFGPPTKVISWRFGPLACNKCYEPPTKLISWPFMPSACNKSHGLQQLSFTHRTSSSNHQVKPAQANKQNPGETYKGDNHNRLHHNRLEHALILFR